MRGVRYEHEAAAAVDTARVFWPRTDDVMQMLEWALIRDTSAGVPVMPESHIRLVVFPGAKSIKMPTVYCCFEVSPDQIIFHDLEFS